MSNYSNISEENDTLAIKSPLKTSTVILRRKNQDI